MSIWKFKCPNCGKVFDNALIFLLHKEKCFSLVWKRSGGDADGSV